MGLAQNFKLTSIFCASFKKEKLCVCTKECFNKVLKPSLMTSQLQSASAFVFSLSHKVL